MSERGARESFARRLQGALSGDAGPDGPVSGSLDAWLRLLLCLLLPMDMQAEHREA